MAKKDRIELARDKAKKLHQSRSTKQTAFLKKYEIPEKKKQELEAPNEKYYLTPKGIAENLGLSYQTVMKHLQLATETEGLEGLKHRRKGPLYVICEEGFEEWYKKYIGE